MPSNGGGVDLWGSKAAYITLGGKKRDKKKAKAARAARKKNR